MQLAGTILPLALVVALSPLPVLPALLLLLGPRARRNGPAYLAAWLAALTLVVTVALLLGARAEPGPGMQRGIGVVQLVIGTVFLVAGLVKWVRRSSRGAVREAPGWLATLDSYDGLRSARLGALMVAANPKNLPMALAAGAQIAVLTDAPGPAVLGVLGFVGIGSVGVAGPIVTHAVAGERAEPTLRRAKAWLIRNGDTLTLVVLLVVGALLVVQGLAAIR